MSQADAVVVGAGITGLACAYRLQKLGVETLVLESGDRIGGVIRSERIDGHLVDEITDTSGDKVLPVLDTPFDSDRRLLCPALFERFEVALDERSDAPVLCHGS